MIKPGRFHTKLGEPGPRFAQIVNVCYLINKSPSPLPPPNPDYHASRRFPVPITAFASPGQSSTPLSPSKTMTARDLKDPEYLAKVAACCEEDNKDHFLISRPEIRLSITFPETWAAAVLSPTHVQYSERANTSWFWLD